MGLLRLLLALSVVIAHSGLLFGYTIANAQLAVLSFFVISGFYMALILDKKYLHKSIYLFYTNRLLRIMPLYWITLILFLLFTSVKYFWGVGGEDNAITHYLVNTTYTSPAEFIGNLINFIIRNITLIITADYFFPNDSTPGYLLVQQAWTLQIELLFYAIVPFLMFMTRRVFLLFLGFYLMVLFYGNNYEGLFRGTLSYAFFEYLFYFLLGILSYRYLYKNIDKVKQSSAQMKMIAILFICYLLFYNYLVSFQVIPWIRAFDVVYFSVLVLVLPIFFMVTQKNVFDRKIGELSYPVYIIHFLIIKAVDNLPISFPNASIKSFFIILITIVIAWFLVKLIEIPIDRYRQKRMV